jgi:hypothetical protein
MSEGVIDDPVATLKGLVFGAYELEPGDIIPVDKMLETISGAMSEMVSKIGGAIDALPEN